MAKGCNWIHEEKKKRKSEAQRLLDKAKKQESEIGRYEKIVICEKPKTVIFRKIK